MPAKKPNAARTRKTTTPTKAAAKPAPKKSATKTAARKPTPAKTITGKRTPPARRKTPPMATIPAGELPKFLATGFKSLRADLGRKTDKTTTAALKRLEEGYTRLLK